MKGLIIPALLLLATGCRGEPSSPAARAGSSLDLRRDPWIAARQRGVDFRAVGQEPGWYAEVDHGQSIRLVWDYADRSATLPAVEPETAGRQTRYVSNSGTHRVTIVAEERPCHDGMSGQPFSLTVTVTIDGRELRGCGRALHAERTSWRADGTSVGPVRTGMSRSQVAAAVGVPAAAREGRPAQDACQLVSLKEAPGVLAMFIGDEVARIDVTAPGVATEAGVEVGMREELVREAYGRQVTESPHKYTEGRYLTVSPDAVHRIVFEAEHGWVTRYRVGRLPEVEWVEGCA